MLIDNSYKVLIGYLLINLIRTCLIYMFFDGVFNKKIKNEFYLILSYIGYYLGISFIYIFINIPNITLLINLIGIFLITLNYEINSKRRIYFYIILCIIFMTVEAVIVLLDRNFNVNILNNNYYIEFYKNIFSQFISFILINLILRLKNINYTNIKIEKYNIYFTLISIFTVPIILMMVLSSKINNFEKFIYIIAILVINIISLKMYDKLFELFNENLKNSYLKAQTEYFKKNIDILVSNLKQTNSLKHDIKNHLIVIKNLCNEEDLQKLNLYIENLTKDFLVYKSSINTNNLIIDSILNSKVYEMELKNIYNEINVIIPPKLKGINDSDITIILGNLLDNAIEASMKIEPENRKILLHIIYNKGLFLINLKNNFDGVVKYKNNKIISTKENDIFHGIGIKNIEEVVKKYNGNLKIEFDEKTFSTEINIFI